MRSNPILKTVVITLQPFATLPKWRAHALAGTTPRERQTRMRALAKIRAVLWILSYEAEKTVLFVGDSSGEENSSSLRREHIPQAIKLERSSIGAH